MSRLNPYEEKMTEIIQESLWKNMATIRAGRANPHILDRITVDYYGTPTPITAGRQISMFQSQE